MKIHHVALTVSDLGVSEEFYVNNFGLSVAHRYKKEDVGAVAVYLASGTAYLELLSFNEKKIGVHTDLGVTGIKHVAFYAEDIDQEHARLTANGLTCTKPKLGGSGGVYFFTSDPDGHQLEIYQKPELSV